MKFKVEIEREEDGRWIAEVPQLPGVLAYGASPEEAQAFKNMYAALGSTYKVARGLGLMRLIGAQVVGDPALSAETRAAIAVVAYAPRSTDTTTAEAIAREASDGQLAAAPSLGDLPLVVLASDQNMTGLANWAEAQRLMAALIGAARAAGRPRSTDCRLECRDRSASEREPGARSRLPDGSRPSSRLGGAESCPS